MSPIDDKPLSYIFAHEWNSQVGILIKIEKKILTIGLMLIIGIINVWKANKIA